MSARRHWRRWTRRRRVHPAAVLLGLLGAYWAGDVLLQEVAAHAVLIVSVVVVALLAGGLAAAAQLRMHRRREQQRLHRAHTLNQILALNSTTFEFFTADLLRRDGCTQVRRVGGAGDFAADNLARLPDGRKLLVQDKFYALSNRVSSEDVQKVGGTWKVIHGADVALIVTTSHLTRDAAEYCRRAKFLVCEREQLAAWAAGGKPPWA